MSLTAIIVIIIFFTMAHIIAIMVTVERGEVFNSARFAINQLLIILIVLIMVSYLNLFR